MPGQFNNQNNSFQNNSSSQSVGAYTSPYSASNPSAQNQTSTQQVSNTNPTTEIAQTPVPSLSDYASGDNILTNTNEVNQILGKVDVVDTPIHSIQPDLQKPHETPLVNSVPVLDKPSQNVFVPNDENRLEDLNKKILDAVEQRNTVETSSNTVVNPLSSENVVITDNHTQINKAQISAPVNSLNDVIQKEVNQLQLPEQNQIQVQTPVNVSEEEINPANTNLPTDQISTNVQQTQAVENLVPEQKKEEFDIYRNEENLRTQLQKPDIKPVQIPMVSEIVKNVSPEQKASKLNGIEKGSLDPERDLKNFTPKNLDGSDFDMSEYSHIDQLLDLVIKRNASDLHLSVGYPPFIRVDDRLMPVGVVLDKPKVETLINQALTSNHRELLEVNREVDLSYQFKELGRFRINAYYEKGNLAAAFRLIPQKIKSISDLQLPGILFDICGYSQGLFLVTGPTGSGKSTTLAAMIQYINESSPKHIITIEDPIEYVYPKARALVDQRELGGDTHDWSIALKSALRQDPDVLLIGEMRDFETIQSALTLAETGHLVFATLHTNSAAQSIDRIVDVFPPHQQEQVKSQLASVLKGILSQRLVPMIGGGRVAVAEMLMVTPAVQNLIREGKTYQLDNVISTGTDLGMISLEKSLVKLVREGKITTATAQEYAIRPNEVLKLMKGGF